MQSISISPPQVAYDLQLPADDLTAVVFNHGAPRPLQLTALDTHFVLAFTPTGLVATFGFTAGLYVDYFLVNCTPRFLSSRGFDMNTACRYLRAWVRRKPGTSGAIVAQQIVFEGSTGLVTGAWEESDDLFTASAGVIPATGQPFTLTAITGGTGLTQGNTYYAIRISSTTMKAASSYANALAGTPVNVTLDGTGVTITPGYIRIGTINVEAASASATAEPVADFLDLSCAALAGNTAWNFNNATPFKVTFGNADANLEVVFEAHGNAAV